MYLKSNEIPCFLRPDSLFIWYIYHVLKNININNENYIFIIYITNLRLLKSTLNKQRRFIIILQNLYFFA